MSNIRFTGILTICAALAACSDTAPQRGVTAPGVGPALNEAPADQTYTPVAGGESIVITEQIDPAQAATGGRATGHYSILVAGAVEENNSFTALSTETFPNAKGEMEWHATILIIGLDFRLHANVDCLAITGNQAWVSGPAERFIVGGVEQPVGFHVQFRVEDNGEGAKDPPDRASQLFFSAPQGCQFRPLLPLFPSNKGNVQVRQ
jgi:hypothetical protein